MTTNRPDKIPSHSYARNESKNHDNNSYYGKNSSFTKNGNGPYENLRIASDGQNREQIDFFRQAKERNLNKKNNAKYESRNQKQSSGRNDSRAERLFLDLKWEKQRNANLQAKIEDSVPTKEYDRVVNICLEREEEVKVLKQKLNNRDYISKSEHEETLEKYKDDDAKKRAEIEKKYNEKIRELKGKLEKANDKQRSENENNRFKTCADRIIKAQGTFYATAKRIYAEELMDSGIIKPEDFNTLKQVGRTSIDIGKNKRAVFEDLISYGKGDVSKKIKIVDDSGLGLGK